MNPDRPHLAEAGPTGRCRAALVLFVFVFSTRAWLIRTWGSPVPYWDEWDAQALGLFRPWLDGTFRWADLFAPHNEHRIVLTRLADLALFAAGGSWNLWWQLLLNATLHAAIATTLLSLCWNNLPRPVRPFWLLGLSLLFIAPVGWQNALWGFQSQVYFCGVLSVLALGGLLLMPPFKPRWWLGWLAALLALFSVGSGVFAALAALLVSTLALVAQYFSDRKSAAVSSMFPLLVISVIVALGWVLRVDVPHHAPLHAHSPTQFGAVFFRCLSWPWVDSPWLWSVLQAPLLWFSVQLFLRRHPLTSTEKLILGLGLLAGLHAAAVAYSRGAGLVEARPLSRYQDPLLLGVTANFLLLLTLAVQGRFGRIATLLWSGIFLAGLLTLTTTNLSLHLPFKRMQDTAGLSQIRSYLANHDAGVFAQQPGYYILHPDAAIVQTVLDDPQLRRVLPRELSDPSARPPWLIEYSPWFVLLSFTALLAAALTHGTFRRRAQTGRIR